MIKSDIGAHDAGSDKAEALPAVSSSKDKSGEAGVVEDIQRVNH